MTTVEDLLERVDGLDIGFESSMSIEDTKEQLVLKQQMQMLQGLDSSGKKIGEYQSPVYAEAKHRLNPLAGFGNVDLRLTGAFFRDQFVDVRDDEYVIDSADEKADALVKKYGDDIFGLSTDFEAEYVENDLEPVLIDNVREKIQL